ncbi:MAG TPA: hypothetical protein VD866_07150 [Urbifossiella sp.]|nr:hypothetical protein [Urbifossiella sp.]
MYRPRPRSIRTEVLALAVGFVVVQIALVVLIETRGPGIRDPNYGRKLELLRARIREHPGRPVCLALGSSRMMNGLRPADLPPLHDAGGTPVTVFNFGIPMCGPLQEAITLERLLAEGVRPHWLVLEVTPALLGQAEEVDGVLPPERRSLSDLSVAHGSPGPTAYADWVRARAVPTFTYRHALLSRALPAWVPWGSRLDYVFDKTDADGWTRLVPPEDPAVREWARTAEITRFGGFARCGVAASAREGFERLTRAVKAHDIRVLVVVMPEGSELREVYPAEQWAEFGRATDDLARDLGAVVVSAREWMPDAAFADGHHLLPDGAGVFTRRFGAEALAPFLAR